jgi:hypothetical protein
VVEVEEENKIEKASCIGFECFPDNWEDNY